VLAAEGLGEARRAVAALSTGDAESDTRVEGDEVAAGVTALIASHRSLGGSAKLVETGRRLEVTKRVSVALRRAVQEGLTNARKHAPGKPVTVTVRWKDEGVTVEIANPLGAPAQVTGGGHGLVGMRDRFSALPGGIVTSGVVTSGVGGDRFVVTARAATARTAA
jgi:signal transduction histidine kinase